MMTNKMKMFCLEYLIDSNASAAARRAGYSKKTAQMMGSENLSKPIIQIEIERLKDILIDDKKSIIFENIQYWKKVLSNEKSKESDKLKASEYLGKYAAMFTEKIDLTGHLQHEILEPVSLDDLESQILDEKIRDEE